MSNIESEATMETLKIACKACGATEEIGGVDEGGAIYGSITSAAFLTVHLNGCHQAEVESGYPPHLWDIFTITGGTE